MKEAHILYVNYFKPDGTDLSVGGIQTYISNLITLLKSMGYGVHVYQKSVKKFRKEHAGAEVIGVVTDSDRPQIIGKNLFKECKRHFDREHDILIFGCDNYICNTGGIPFIAIQHGITWDKPENKNRDYWMLKKFYRGWLTVNRVEKADMLVCVDYNFVNWYRAMVAKPAVKIVNIPNFTEIAPKIAKPDDGVIRIIFARRFFDYRGTRIFGTAVKKLLLEFKNIKVTLAGDGPDEGWLRKQFIGFPNVKFITYASGESLKVHADKDIAVVPTLGSEGTSLSLLEAMSTQCAVICTNVGGMTDIVLNGFNGLIVNPDTESIYESLRLLVADCNLRRRMSENAYTTVKECFSQEIWFGRWKEVIENFESRRQL